MRGEGELAASGMVVGVIIVAEELGEVREKGTRARKSWRLRDGPVASVQDDEIQE
jgi:hypothetical protein